MNYSTYFRLLIIGPIVLVLGGYLMDLSYPFPESINGYYGQLALEYLGYDENISWNIKNPGSFFKLDVLNNEHIKRAIALSSIGRYGEADQEMRFVYGILGNDKIYELIELTNYLNLPAVQLRLGDKLFQKGEMSYLALFPSPQWFKNQERKIDEVLLWSLMRKESSFYLNVPFEVRFNFCYF